MDQQRRCLTGMTNGVPIAVPVEPADAAVIHTFSTATGASDSNGLPALDVVTLVIDNRDSTNPARFSITVGAVALICVVAAGQVTRVFNETPFGGSLSAPVGGLTITVVLDSGENLSTSASAWGWFVRTGG